MKLVLVLHESGESWEVDRSIWVGR